MFSMLVVALTIAAAPLSLSAPDEEAPRVGELRPNAKKTGIYWQVAEDVSVCGPSRVEFLPRREE